ncbi:MAG: alanine racemase [Atopostipes suicloacalis]|nr:alanine racemase [Atopostipes suicloacalis]
MKFTDVSLSQAVIYKKKLLENIQAFKEIIAPETNFMAVIKADAYGHGAVELAETMEKEQVIDYFGVAQLQEALELREAAIQSPILIFNETRLKELPLALKNEISLTVFSKDHAKEIVRLASQLKKEAVVHLKIDSGMGRIGLRNFREAYELYQILDSDFVKVEGIYTHFADANEKDPENFSHEQYQFFQEILEKFKEQSVHFDLRHACNTAATINYPNYQLDMVRVGLGLYGFDPSHSTKNKIKLQPIQNIHAEVTMVKDFPAGESIGYNRHYFSKEKMRVATIGIGYADGVAKSLSNKGTFGYQGKQLPIVGDICMDQIMIDSSTSPELKVGDFLTYFGDPNEGYSSVSELAEIIDGSTYELLCRIGNRVQRIYK